MTQVAIGTSLTVSVDPRPFFVPTGIEVDPGQRYSFTASGKWKDWFRIVGPEGWKLWPLHLRNRVPRAAFFCLCGCVGNDDHDAFSIGASCAWQVPVTIAGLPDNQLYLFANDWRSRYGNNHALPPDKGGPLNVTITRLA